MKKASQKQPHEEKPWKIGDPRHQIQIYQDLGLKLVESGLEYWTLHMYSTQILHTDIDVETYQGIL